MSELSRIIAEEIHRKGPISVARFMELALYCPVYGYYERDADSLGRGGDFHTSVSVGSVFGELLAARFASWLDRLKQHGLNNLQIVEAGAHDGRLAVDILQWLKSRRPDLLEDLKYDLLEPSATRRQWQRKLLGDSLESVRWVSGFDELRQIAGGVRGVLFCNEFLDALPVHRFAWDRQRRTWFEWLVAERQGRFVWSRREVTNEPQCARVNEIVPRELLSVLQDGYVVEYSPAAIKWWQDAADSLSQGWLIAFDYGDDTNAAIRPARVDGTLRGYRQHQVAADVLSSPGEQDLTAHVHFGLLRATGERHGLNTEFFGEQGRFLVQLLEQVTPSGRDKAALDSKWLRQFRTLVHPDHFGHCFKVLVQSRGC